MHHPHVRGLRITMLCLLGAALLCAQDWQNATSLPSVDLQGLTPAQQALALKVLRNQGCVCGCDMKLAECRIKDPSCSYSKGLSAVVLDAVRKGGKEADVVAAVKASPLSHREPAKLLGSPVAIPIDGAPFLGPRDARVTLVEFSDFQCPYCAKAVGQLSAVLKAYPTQVKLVFKQFPLEMHSQAAFAAAAAMAAHQQGKFWPMHDAMYADWQHLSRQNILAWAAKVGLEMKRFELALDAAQTKKAVEREVEEGERAGVEATPTVFIDGQKYNGSLALDAMRSVIDAELKRPAQKK